MEYKGIEYLRTKLNQKRGRVRLRYKYYDQKKQAERLGATMPPILRGQLTSVMGWCATGVDQLADRIVFHKFRGDIMDMNDIFAKNSKDIFVDSAILGSLISSCDFIYISPDEEGFPRLQVIDGGNATGIIDPVTNMLTEGYAVLKRNDLGAPILEAYMNDQSTWIYVNGKLDEAQTVENPSPYALLVPMIYRPDATRPFGHSRISRTGMSLQRSAERTLLRSEVAAEFYSFPQKYVLGLDPDAEQVDKWQATMSSFLRFDKDADGDHPVIGQFQQQSMSPYNDQLKTIAGQFCGETGLTLDDLGFVSDNPSSAEAIKASHDRLRLIARKAQRCFSVGLVNTGYLASCLRDKQPYRRELIQETSVVWNPIFEPDASTISLIGDGAIKMNQAIPGYFDKENLFELTGFGDDEE